MKRTTAAQKAPAYFAEQKRRHDAAPSEHAQEVLRYCVRKWCARYAVAVPEWAQCRPRAPQISRAGRADFHPEPLEKKSGPARSDQSAPASQFHRHAALSRYPERRAHPDAAPVTLDPRLSAWRERNPGSVVHVGQGGVTLYAGVGERPKHFRDVGAALTAIEV